MYQSPYNLACLLEISSGMIKKTDLIQECQAAFQVVMRRKGENLKSRIPIETYGVMKI
jgi:hypothetical protein